MDSAVKCGTLSGAAPLTHSPMIIMGVEERSSKASPLKLPLQKSEPFSLAVADRAAEREMDKIFKEVLEIMFGWLQNIFLVGCKMQKHLQSYTICLFGYNCYSSLICNSNLTCKNTARGLPGSPSSRVFQQKAL